MRVYSGDDESACKEVSLKRSGTTVLLDNISNKLFHHSGPARRFHHRHWEANWYMFFSLVITGALCASFNCPTACSHYEFLEGSTSEFLMNSVNFEKAKRSEKRSPWAQKKKFWSPKKKKFQAPTQKAAVFCKETHPFWSNTASGALFIIYSRI